LLGHAIANSYIRSRYFTACLCVQRSNYAHKAQIDSAILTMPASPPLSAKPKALPSYLTNGHSSPLQNPLSLRDNSERDNLYASIKSSNGPRRQPIDFRSPLMAQNGDRLGPAPATNNGEGVEQLPARDSRDEAPPTPPYSASRSVSPMTARPTVDFDGLSWPSEYCAGNIRLGKARG